MFHYKEHGKMVFVYLDNNIYQSLLIYYLCVGLKNKLTMIIQDNYSLQQHNTFNLDIKTRWFVQYDSEEELKRLLSDEYFFSQSFWHIGQGSNLLFLDDFNGVIVHSGIKGIEKIKEDDDSVWLKVGAAEVFDSFVSYCVDNGWGGIENLSLIPGEVGASAFQNIGAYGVEAADCIEEVHTFCLKSGEKKIFLKEECNYSYRNSFFKEDANRGLYYITYVVYRLHKTPNYKLDYGNVRQRLEGKEINLKNIRQAVIDIRKEKLPDHKVWGNAGSFFTNPYVSNEKLKELQALYTDMPFYTYNKDSVKIPAAWLIEQCGLKGLEYGGAAIYEKQPLVIINKNNATGNDIALLAEEVRTAVINKFGIELMPEVNYI
ncbi:UDP-N-acetylmuramate dehydrogenase [Dysgonomonadaceae bacterium PH5-43]|nr:UDP-N-acetylmuramate dehydrogenase [Dysgonomonadaceae bacterium PH5-43]